jgi:hypothetical protein
MDEEITRLSSSTAVSDIRPIRSQHVIVGEPVRPPVSVPPPNPTFKGHVLTEIVIHHPDVSPSHHVLPRICEMSTTTTTITAHGHGKPADDLELRSIDHASPNPPAEAIEDRDSGISNATLLKVVSAAFSFFFAGANDGSLGALTPYILRTYNLGTEWISLMYLY